MNHVRINEEKYLNDVDPLQIDLMYTNHIPQKFF